MKIANATLAQLKELETQGKLVGVFDVNIEDYHAGPGLSKSGLDQLGKSALHFAHSKKEKKPPTDNMILGSALDCWLLDGPDAFKARFEVCEGKRPNGYKHRQIKLLRPEDMQVIREAAASVASHDLAGKIVTEGIKQASFYWKDAETGVTLKCRPDIFLPDKRIVVDLKFTEDASWTSFRYTAMKHNYHAQDAFYTNGIGHAIEQAKINIEKPDTFVFLSVENSAPYGVALFTLSPETRDLGATFCRNSITSYFNCLKSGEWPGYPTEVQTVHFPQWKFAEVNYE